MQRRDEVQRPTKARQSACGKDEMKITRGTDAYDIYMWRILKAKKKLGKCYLVVLAIQVGDQVEKFSICYPNRQWSG